jgi:heterodisulfide reductase subunit B
LLGLALGVSPKKLGLGKEFISAMPFLSRFMTKEAK